jgi:hypothetical protein
MTSQVNPYNIDETFPVAGQDNPSQGFRNNFTNIQNNLQTIKDEIDDLHAKVLVKTPLNGVAFNNDLSGNVISNATLGGNLTITGPVRSTNYVYNAMAANDKLEITIGRVNAGQSTYYVDNVSGSENLLSNIAVVLPTPGATVANGAVIAVSTICPITNVVWTAATGGSTYVKGVNSTDLQTKGSSVRLQHIAFGVSTYWVKAP